MTKHITPSLVALVLTTAVISSAFAQSPGGQMQIGPVNMTFAGGKYVGNSLHLSVVVMTSKNYDLRAASIIADMPPATGGAAKAPSFSKIIANGDPVKKTQVTGRFVSAELARTYLIRGDKAVYIPDTSRLNGGRIDFTGHVVVTLQAPQALDGPAVTQLEQASVLVGPKPDYPQVEFGAGHLDFTPLQ